jgi:hypothetical protein
MIAGKCLSAAGVRGKPVVATDSLDGVFPVTHIVASPAIAIAAILAAAAAAAWPE